MLLPVPGRTLSRGLTIALLVCSLAACVQAPRRAPPVEDRSTRSPAAAVGVPAGAAVASAASAPDATKPLPGAENAGKPGYYTVKPGDTMIRIGLETGQNWKDIARWNGMENVNVIEVGQVLRVVPPTVDPTVVAAKPVASTKVEARPLDTKPGVAAASAPGGSASGSAVAAPPQAPVITQTPSASANRDDDELNWAWPASGAVLAGYDEARNKGLAIGGKAGDPVTAAADGRVVYAGSGLRGYGNLVIVKHNTTYLTAYAHNQTLLVKEDQPVKRGQKIAEMGATDAERVQLHFEIRKLGKPVDPVKLLPPR
ncbi:peptidoglycan DD-metalloendopeptidase family protein [Methylibium sp.]|jgi:lipoprotein NlpD|uniref:peptidoglycan DD-metalloendopeptidase family protein n=1 Tax=Methylibium sp. TaxID=2067992 RepID=UPI003D1174BA